MPKVLTRRIRSKSRPLATNSSPCSIKEPKKRDPKPFFVKTILILQMGVKKKVHGISQFQVVASCKMMLNAAGDAFDPALQVRFIVLGSFS